MSTWLAPLNLSNWLRPRYKTESHYRTTFIRFERSVDEIDPGYHFLTAVCLLEGNYSMTKILVYISVAFVLITATLMALSYRTRGGPCRTTGFFSSSDVTFSEFIESVPANGTMKDKLVNVEIDELYFHRIKVGLNAISNSSDLVITHVDSIVVSGRFSIKLKFNDSQEMPLDGQSVRLRIFLSDPIQTTLLPVGGFYKDTGGKWILVVKGSTHVVKRFISLGRKNPDYFEVLSGLIPGEKVITSSYENYTHFDFNKPIALDDLRMN